MESNLVSVWLALRDEADVSVSVWEGIALSGAGNPFVTSNPERTWRIGDKLHLALVTARIPENAGKSFQTDTLYSYDVTIKVGPNTHTLQSLNMLRDIEAKDSPDGIDHVALGYQTDVLPSFAPSPSELTDVRILYGSCRRPGHRDPDAMVWIDDNVREHLDDPRARPHQLFLGGDQIYADDVDTLFMLGLMDLGIELIGITDAGDPLEHVLVDRVLKRLDPPPPALKPGDYHKAYVEDTVSPVDLRLPIDGGTFPAGHRLKLTQRAAQFTSSDGSNHLISLGEFAAMYLLVWSNACWRDQIRGVQFAPNKDSLPDRKPLGWSTTLTTDNIVILPPLAYTDDYPDYLFVPPLPDRISEHLFPKPNPNATVKPDTRTDEEKQKAAADKEKKRQRGLRRSHQYHAQFLAGLPRVRRAMANIPTYMVFDDHDITDDFFLNPVWRDRVLTTALGHTIFNNGMLAYALFQDWGNDPRRYDEGLRAELVTRGTELFPVGTPGPVTAPFERLSVLFGHDLRPEPDGVGGFRAVDPPIHWHFTIDAPTHRTIVLDNRTRRSYQSRLGPPGNVSVDAMVDQIPLPPLLAGQEMLVVVAPLQVIGPPVIDDVVAPLTYRIFDLADAIGKDPEISADSPSGRREMLGTNPDAIETWGFDATTFEHLLRRLEPYRRVVLLSGDVHNSTGTMMSYWSGQASQPAHFAQFTSSGLKNVMPSMITAVDRAAGFAQQLIRANLGTERIGWKEPGDNLVLLPEDATVGDLTPNMRSRLVSTPVMIPTWGWPDRSRLNPDVPPDWRWRVTPLFDRRADEDRPEPIRQLVIDLDKVDSDLEDKATIVNAYQAVAARHQHALGHLRNARQILFRSNYGVCRFQTNAVNGHLEAVHEVYTAFTDPNQPAAEAPTPQPYLVQVADLDRDDELPPFRLRRFAIEPIKPDV